MTLLKREIEYHVSRRRKANKKKTDFAKELDNFNGIFHSHKKHHYEEKGNIFMLIVIKLHKKDFICSAINEKLQGWKCSQNPK